MVRRTAWPGLVVTVMMLAVVPGAYAQAEGEVAAPNEKGVPPNRDYLALLPFEVIDTASNNLILRFTDLVLPGNAGRDLRIERVFSNSTFGVGWRMGIAGVPMRVVEKPTRWLTTNDFNPVTWDLQYERLRTPSFLTLEGGSIRTTYWAQPTDQQPSQHLVRTSDFGQYNRGTFILLQADGTRARYCAPTPPSPETREPGCPGEGYLKELSDPFGNTVTLAWQETGEEGTGYVTARLASLTQDLGNGQTREVTFGASTDLWVPGSMTYLDRIWEYDFVDGHLMTVTLPEGLVWEFEYSTEPDLSEGKVKKVTTPQEGTVEYTFGDRFYPVITPAFVYGTPAPFNVLVERKTDDDVQGEQIWLFEPLGLETSPYTQVVRPDGTELIYFYEPAHPNTVLEGAWRLHRVEVRANGVTVETEERDYDYLQAARTPASNELWGLSQPIWRTITRNVAAMATTHKTEYAYGSVGAHFHNYHHPATITERGSDGEVRRTTTRTYTHLAAMPSTPYMLGLPASEAVTEEGVTTTSSRTYLIATGFRDRDTVDGFETTFTADALGNVATVTKENGNGIEMTYQWGVVKDVTTQAGVNTARTINPDGTVESETIANRTTTYEYDKLMRRTEVQPPGGTLSIVTTYPTATTTKTTRGSASLETTTDGFGRPIKTENAVDVHTRTAYDGIGRVTYQSYPFTGDFGGTNDMGTELTYDTLGRVTQERLPDGATRTRSYDDTNLTVTVTDEKDRDTILTYRGYGHPDDARLVTVVDAAEQTWTYEYDVRGNLAQVTTPTGHTRTWSRDDTSGLLNSETHPESGTILYTDYDDAGVLKRKVDANETEFVYAHDGNDRLTQITAGSRVTSISYEPGSNNRLRVSNGDVSTTFGYETTTGRLAQRLDEVGGYAFTSGYGYNLNDQLTTLTYPTLTYPSGRIVSYDRDDADRITGVVEAAVNRSYASAMDYHPSGALEQYTAGNGIDTTISYDPHRYWVTAISAGALQLTYDQYDAVGNVETIGDSGPGMGWSLTYDSLDRLETADNPSVFIGYEYDPHGNRRTAYANTFTYESGTLRLATQNGEPFTYDSNGNLETTATDSFTYTPDNMLASATVTGGVTVTYAYDADNWRAKRTAQSDTTYYLRGLQGELLTELKIPTTGNATTRDYIYAGTRLLSVVEKTITPPASNDIYGSIVPNGPAVTQAMNTAGKRVLLQFQGLEGHRYRAAAWLTAGDFGCGAWLELRTAAGDLVANAASSFGCSSLLLEAVTLPENGTYYVVLDPLGSGTGTGMSQ